MDIITKKDYVIVNIKNNNKHIIKSIIMLNSMSLLVCIVIFSTLGTEVLFIIYSIIKISIIVSFIVILLNKLSLNCDEQMVITEGKVILRFGIFGYYPYICTINNNNRLIIKFDSSMKTVLNIYMGNEFFFPGKCRTLKLITPTKTYSYGYNLSKQDFDTIENFILKKRELSKEKNIELVVDQIKISKTEEITIIEMITKNQKIEMIFFLIPLVFFILFIYYINRDSITIIFVLMVIVFSNSIKTIANKLIFYDTEKIIIKKDVITLKFGYFGFYWNKYEINNSDLLIVNYDSSERIPNRFDFLNLKKYRRMKFIESNKNYSYGYNLSKQDFDVIQGLMLEKRAFSKNNKKDI